MRSHYKASVWNQGYVMFFPSHRDWISNMFEKCINHQLLQYFESHRFLRHDQSAFRKGHSTGTALHKLVNDLLDNICEGMNAICFLS